MAQTSEMIVAFFVGALSSSAVALLYERSTQPDLDIIPDYNERSQGQITGNPPHEFYHVVVINKPGSRLVRIRRPAWSTSAMISVKDDKNQRFIKDVTARWTSQPEPHIPFLYQNQIVNIIDPARIVYSSRVDVHSHTDQHLPIILKYEGEKECYIFSNASYGHNMWKKPEWMIPPGVYTIEVRLNYDGGPRTFSIDLENTGISRDDVKLVLKK